MWPRFWQSQLFKIIGTALLGPCLSTLLNAQTTPLDTPPSVDYPGILQSFEKLIQIDTEKFQRKADQLAKSGKVFPESAPVTSLDLDPDYLNSLVLHSDAGYVRLASMSKCRFYDVLINDLLKSAEGKVKNIFVTYLNVKGDREYSLMTKKEFLAKVITQECPETQALTNQFQVKNFEATLKKINFEVPTGIEQCRNIHAEWLTNPQTPYLCHVYEYIKEASVNQGDPKDLDQRKAVAKILSSKQTPLQKDYLENLCPHLDNEDLFCDEFLNVSFWSKVAGGHVNRIYAEDICSAISGNASPSDVLLKQCLSKMKKENDLCLYPKGNFVGLAPQPQCDSLALALTHSSFRSNYRDCPGASDQHGVTNLARLLNNITQTELLPHDGPCSSVSAGVVLDFNKRFDNEENWKLEACYQDRMTSNEICKKMFFGKYGDLPESYAKVVAEILVQTRGADARTTCSLVDSVDYSPLLLQFKTGCFIIYDKNKCHLSECKHKILYNDRPVDFITIKNRMTLDYFPLNVVHERVSQHYLLTRDFKQNGRSLNNMSSIISFFKRSKKGVIHGVACAEDILPTFVKSQAFNQCTPLPFIIDGLVRENDKTVFVTRTALDSLQAPRLIGWSFIYSGVKSYQRFHPLRLWTLYGLD